MNIKRILQRIPMFASKEDFEITELTGGITNKNYKITADGESFVLRMGGNETKHLGIDRSVEYECSRLASQIGVAPDPVAFIAPEGFILARFISGKGMSAEEIGKKENIERVLESMKAYHALENFPGFFSPFRVAEEYAKTARSFNVQLPAKMDWYLEKSSEIETAMYGREPLQLRPCHNDLLNGNFIDDGTRIRILDWEYAGMGDIFFDLGNFAVQHEFTVEQDDILLNAYFGDPTDSQRAHLKLMKIMSDLREAMWAQVQIGVSQLDFDYEGYGQKYFERFEASTSGSDYQKWLREV
ncbi:MAG TPA: choline/ethanolamine kinase family protein [Anaerolineales bacterium]|jgi:thiamine kinase-like enzyme|nr:choline/ethanolamine kinase family protein [Anaerolineales bacterium]